MITLLGITLTTSAADSLNPIAIAQQLSLQAVSQRKKDIRGFISGIALTNFAAGMLVFLGLDKFINSFLAQILSQFPHLLPLLSLLAGVILFYIVFRPKKTEEAAEVKKGLNSRQLFGLGIIACLLELTSALPYFAFLALLTQYSLNFAMLAGILILYNFIYSAPLIALYFCSIYFEERLAGFYLKFSRGMVWLQTYLIPPVLFMVAFGLIGFALYSFV